MFSVIFMPEVSVFPELITSLRIVLGEWGRKLDSLKSQI